MRYAICNINIQIPVSDNATEDEAITTAENYELPKEYVSDSFEFITMIDE